MKDKGKKSTYEKNNLWVIVALLIFILGLFLYGQLKDYFQQKRLNNSGNTTICSVTEKGYTKGPDIIVQYSVYDKQYTKRSGSPCKIEIGEEFEIVYNVTDPSDSKINFSKPIIPEYFIQTKGKISRIDNGFFKRV